MRACVYTGQEKCTYVRGNFNAIRDFEFQFNPDMVLTLSVLRGVCENIDFAQLYHRVKVIFPHTLRNTAKVRIISGLNCHLE